MNCGRGFTDKCIRVIMLIIAISPLHLITVNLVKIRLIPCFDSLANLKHLFSVTNHNNSDFFFLTDLITSKMTDQKSAQRIMI